MYCSSVRLWDLLEVRNTQTKKQKTTSVAFNTPQLNLCLSVCCPPLTVKGLACHIFNFLCNGRETQRRSQQQRTRTNIDNNTFLCIKGMWVDCEVNTYNTMYVCTTKCLLPLPLICICSTSITRYVNEIFNAIPCSLSCTSDHNNTPTTIVLIVQCPYYCFTWPLIHNNYTVISIVWNGSYG